MMTPLVEPEYQSYSTIIMSCKRDSKVFPARVGGIVLASAISRVRLDRAAPTGDADKQLSLTEGRAMPPTAADPP